jgi:hypothetical protein
MILFTCAQCGASLQVQDQLIGQFTVCLSCRSSVPVPIPDVSAGPSPLPAEALPAEPAGATSPITANPSPFAHLDDAGGPSVTSSRFAEQAHGIIGWEALGPAVAALVLTFIPGCNLLAPLLALLGLVLAIDGIIKCNAGIPDASGMGVYITGLVLSLVVGGFWGTMLLNAVVRGAMG